MPSTNKHLLKTLGLPVCEDLSDLSLHLRLSEELIRYCYSRSDYLYNIYGIPKKNGGTRIIAQPSRELKAIQAWILRNILDKLSASEVSKGFEKGVSIRDNAIPHIGSTYILNIDLKDFFNEIEARKIYTIFKSVGYKKSIAAIFTNICTYKGYLPQGSPTSPKLANLVCAQLDSRIAGYAGPRGMLYTRYADDITLSSQSQKHIQNARHFLGTVIAEEGFRINKKKVSIAGPRKRKEVTGLIITEDRVTLGRVFYRKMRAMLHDAFVKNNINNISTINGCLAYVYSVDKVMYKKLYSYIDRLEKKSANKVIKDMLLANKLLRSVK